MIVFSSFKRKKKDLKKLIEISFPLIAFNFELFSKSPVCSDVKFLECVEKYAFHGTPFMNKKPFLLYAYKMLHTYEYSYTLYLYVVILTALLYASF